MSDPAIEREHHQENVSEALREGLTMALYVCLVLAAEFTIVGEHADDEGVVLGVIWGTTMGLALAHVFAFDLAARMFSRGRVSTETRTAALVQLVVAAVVALAATVPFLLFPLDTALKVAGYLVAGFVGAAAYAVARRSGAGHGRSAIYGLSVLAVAILVVSLKVTLAH
jgi:hypothetical protein